jgi:hypothetical protein
MIVWGLAPTRTSPGEGPFSGRYMSLNRCRACGADGYQTVITSATGPKSQASMSLAAAVAVTGRFSS